MAATRLAPAPLKLETTARALWALALPIIFAEASEIVVETTDIALLARFGTLELGAVGLAAAIYEVLVFGAFGLADGIQIVAARRAGQERAAGIGDAFFHGASLMAVAAVVLFGALEFALPWTTRWIVQSDGVRAAVNDYLGILACAAVFHCLNMAYSALYIGIGRTRLLIGATLALAATNIVCAYLLIFGHFGLPRLGIRGAAAGSLIAEIVAFVFFTVRAVRNGDARRFDLFRPRPLNWSLARVLLTISWPAALERLVGTVRWLVFFVLLEHLGEITLAIGNVVHAVYAILLLPVGGFAETVCTTVSNLLGQEREVAIGRLTRRAAGWTGLLVLPAVALTVLAPGLPLSLFTSDPELVKAAAGSLRVVCIALVVVIPGEMAFGALAGTGDTRRTLVTELLLAAAMLGAAYAAGVLLALPLEAVWGSEVLGWFLCLLVSSAWLRRERWSQRSI